jgi:hypothetical protein
MDTTKRGLKGWKEAQRQGEDRVTLRISLLGFHLQSVVPSSSF